MTIEEIREAVLIDATLINRRLEVLKTVIQDAEVVRDDAVAAFSNINEMVIEMHDVIRTWTD